MMCAIKNQTLQESFLLFSVSTAQHSTAQHSTAQHSTAQHSTAQHSTAQHSTAQSEAESEPYLDIREEVN
jgi:hypothetical protein